MRSSARIRSTLTLTLLAVLALAPPAHPEVPNVGGEVSSFLELSLGEPTPFRLSAAAHGERLYTASIGVEVTSTDAPTRLTVADGEAFAGRRRGRMVSGSSILNAPLRARANHGAFGSLDAGADPLLEQWREPVSSATATIRLSQAVRGAPTNLNNYRKLLLVTISAAGP